MKEFRSNIIKEKRKLRSISQAQLGDIVGSQAMVSRIENG
ncbi:helix-turn-helix domain-containing protein, partial [Leuconostoc pseudomesenteroides]